MRIVIRIMESVPSDMELSDTDLFYEVLRCINDIITLIQSYPECDGLIYQLNECKKQIKRLVRR